jgi:hypothetical protein
MQTDITTAQNSKQNQPTRIRSFRAVPPVGHRYLTSEPDIIALDEDGQLWRRSVNTWCYPKTVEWVRLS